MSGDNKFKPVSAFVESVRNKLGVHAATICADLFFVGAVIVLVTVFARVPALLSNINSQFLYNSAGLAVITLYYGLGLIALAYSSFRACGFMLSLHKKYRVHGWKKFLVLILKQFVFVAAVSFVIMTLYDGIKYEYQGYFGYFFGLPLILLMFSIMLAGHLVSLHENNFKLFLPFKMLWDEKKRFLILIGWVIGFMIIINLLGYGYIYFNQTDAGNLGSFNTRLIYVYTILTFYAVFYWFRYGLSMLVVKQ